MLLSAYTPRKSVSPAGGYQLNNSVSPQERYSWFKSILKLHASLLFLIDPHFTTELWNYKLYSEKLNNCTSCLDLWFSTVNLKFLFCQLFSSKVSATLSTQLHNYELHFSKLLHFTSISLQLHVLWFRDTSDDFISCHQPSQPVGLPAVQCSAVQ